MSNNVGDEPDSSPVPGATDGVFVAPESTAAPVRAPTFAAPEAYAPAEEAFAPPAGIPPPPPPPPPGSGALPGPPSSGGSYRTTMAPRAPITHHFSSPRGLGLALRIMLVGWVVLAAISAALSLRLAGTLDALRQNPLAVSPAVYDDRLGAQGAASIIQVLCFLVIAVVWVIWFHRLYRNLPALGTSHGEHSTGWAIGAWFVPFLNFVRPKQIADEIWRTSDPMGPIARNPDDYGLARQRGGVARLVHVWWGVYIFAGVLAWFGGFGSDIRAGSDSAYTRVVWWAIDDMAQLVVGVLAVMVVGGLTSRQERRAAAIAEVRSIPTVDGADRVVTPAGDLDRTQAGTASREAWAVLGAGILILIGVFVAVGAAETDDAALGGIQGDAIPYTDLVIGDCLNLPRGWDPTSTERQAILGVDAVPCTDPHQLEVFSIRPPAAGALISDIPNADELYLVGLETCLRPIETYVGAEFMTTGLDVFLIQPDFLSWRSGERDFTCMLTRLDGELLTGSARGIETVLAADQRTWWSLEVGDCFDEPFGGALQIDTVPCTGPHDYETFVVEQLPTNPGEPYPGEFEAGRQASNLCAEAFPEAVGDVGPEVAFDTGGFPFELIWNNGARRVTCVLWSTSAPLTTPLVDPA